MIELRLIYTTPADIYEIVPAQILGKITDDTGTGNEKPSIITERMKASENLVESYLSVRYKLPLIAKDGTVPGEIKDAVLTIAKYKLYARRNALNASVQSEYDDMINWLKMVASGKADISLPQVDGTYTENGSPLTFGSSYGSLF